MNLDELMKQKELLQQKLGLEGENFPYHLTGTSVVDPNTGTLNLEPDPGLCDKFWEIKKKKFKKKQFSFKKTFFKHKKIMLPEELLVSWGFGLWFFVLPYVLHLASILWFYDIFSSVDPIRIRIRIHNTG